jgi:hypothetical protein
MQVHRCHASPGTLPRTSATRYWLFIEDKRSMLPLAVGLHFTNPQKVAALRRSQGGPVTLSHH